MLCELFDDTDFFYILVRVDREMDDFDRCVWRCLDKNNIGCRGRVPLPTFPSSLFNVPSFSDP